MKHQDIYIVIGVALVLLFLLRFAAKMMLKSMKWSLYGLITAGAVIYAIVRSRK